MSESLRSGPSVPGTTIRALGGFALLASIVISIWSLLNNDPVTAVAVLVYVPVGILLVEIGGGWNLTDRIRFR